MRPSVRISKRFRPKAIPGRSTKHFCRLQKGVVFIEMVSASTETPNRWHIWEWVSVMDHEVFFDAALGCICRGQQFCVSELET
jgi:hypothetical protein